MPRDALWQNLCGSFCHLEEIKNTIWRYFLSVAMADPGHDLPRGGFAIADIYRN